MDENEKLRFELEKQKLEFEKEKLAFEKKKFQESSMKTELQVHKVEEKSKISLALIIFKRINLIATIVLVASAFAPWFSSEGSGYGQSYKQEIDGLQSGHGYYIIVYAIACLVLIIIRNKFSFIPAFLALIHGLYIVSGVGEYKISAYGVSGRIGYEKGPIMVVIASLVIILFSLLSFIKFKAGNRTNTRMDEATKRGYLIAINILLSLLTIPVIYHFNSFNNQDIFLLLLLSGVSVFLLHKLTYKYAFRYFLTGFALILLIRLFYFAFDRNFEIIRDSISLSYLIFKIIFIISFWVIFIYEIIKFRNSEKVNTIWVNIFKPLYLLLIFFIPFLSSFIYFSLTRNNVNDEEANNFNINNKQAVLQQNQTARNTSVNNSSAIPGNFPQASKRLLTSSDLSAFGKQDLKIMRNEIFARHGYIFKTQEMKSYFENQSWYSGQYDDVTSMLSTIEKQNVELIKKYE